MSTAKDVIPDGAEFSLRGAERRASREEFDILEPAYDNGVPARYKKSSWGNWLALAIRVRRRHSLVEGEEADGLLEAPAAFAVYSREEKGILSCYRCGMHGGTTALSILLFLIILNLLFGFATFLQLPKRPDPFAEWGTPGTTSEGLSWYPTDFLRDVNPIPCHSHNDYWRKVPLFSALYNGCISIEADVWAIKNELLIGHNMASLTDNRTFQSLYINPLVKILEHQNPSTKFYNGSNHGVFDTDPEQSLTLLVDVKTDGVVTWPMVLEQLEPLRKRGWLSYMENDALHRRPITVVGTGETPFDVLTANKTYRDAFFDAPLDLMWDDQVTGEPSQPGIENIGDTRDISSISDPAPRSATITPRVLASLASTQRRGQGNSGTNPSDSYSPLNSYYASTSFHDAIGRVWWGRLTNSQMDLIRGQIRGAHGYGLKARYWDLPSWPTSLRNYVWDVLVQEGVDVLNVDDLEAVRDGVWL